ncbi:AzlD domain-containing protein [Alphaproteobacteria bacterium]|nr:AzlD domain-containing protein [Alphaproteobacteria bacterium]
MNENIYISILLASIATYLCRGSGVMLSKKINVNSFFFRWLEYVSMGIIISVVTKIILFPVGVLNDTSLITRLITIIFLLVTYYLTKKNILGSLVLGIVFFTLINYLFYF